MKGGESERGEIEKEIEKRERPRDRKKRGGGDIKKTESMNSERKRTFIGQQRTDTQGIDRRRIHTRPIYLTHVELPHDRVLHAIVVHGHRCHVGDVKNGLNVRGEGGEKGKGGGTWREETGGRRKRVEDKKREGMKGE